MTLEELRAVLVSLGQDPLTVVVPYRDTQAAILRAPLDHWIIREREGLFDVGGEERGRFVTTETFDSESAAYDYLADFFRTTGPVAETAEERAHSKAVTAQLSDQLNEMFPPTSS